MKIFFNSPLPFLQSLIGHTFDTAAAADMASRPVFAEPMRLLSHSPIEALTRGSEHLRELWPVLTLAEEPEASVPPRAETDAAKPLPSLEPRLSDDCRSAQFKLMSAASALAVITLRFVLDEPELCGAVQNGRIADNGDAIFELMSGVQISASDRPGIVDDPDNDAMLRLKVNVSPADRWTHRPLRFGLETVASTLGVFGAAPQTTAAAVAARSALQASIPPLPEFAGGQVHSSLPLTVCYGLDYVELLNDAAEPLSPAVVSTSLCHLDHQPRGNWPQPPPAPGISADTNSIVTLELGDLLTSNATLNPKRRATDVRRGGFVSVGDASEQPETSGTAEGGTTAAGG